MCLLVVSQRNAEMTSIRYKPLVYFNVRSTNCVAYTTWSVLKVINHEEIGKHWSRRVGGRDVGIQAKGLVFDNGCRSKNLFTKLSVASLFTETKRFI